MLRKAHAKVANRLPGGEDCVMLVSGLLMLAAYAEILGRFAGGA